MPAGLIQSCLWLMVVAVPLAVWAQADDAGPSKSTKSKRKETAAKKAGTSDAKTADAKTKDAKSNSPKTANTKQVDGKQAGGKKTNAKIRKVKKKNPVEIPLELQPYQIRILVSFGNDPLLTSGFRREVLDKIGFTAARTVGQMWQLDIEENRWLTPAGVAGLERLTNEAATTRFDPTKSDMVFVLTVELTGSRYRIAARMWDRATQVLGILTTRATYQRRTVGSDAFVAAHQLFRPIANIDEADATSVEIRVRAGEFPAVDPNAAQLKIGTLFQPFFRYYDKKKVLKKVQFLPWTYLSVSKMKRARAQCVIESALRSPLGGGRRRVDKLAIALKPVFNRTQLTLLPRRSPSKPLIGVYVGIVAHIPGEKPAADSAPKEKSKPAGKTKSSKPADSSKKADSKKKAASTKKASATKQTDKTNKAKKKTAPKSKKSGAPKTTQNSEAAGSANSGEIQQTSLQAGNNQQEASKPAEPEVVAKPEPLRLWTDRRGSVTIPIIEQYPLVRLYVRSGKSLLARVPFVPGIASEVTLQLPDDSLRLGVEGQIEILEGDLIETVARRAVYMALARVYARGGKWDKVEEQKKGLKELDGMKEFEAKMTAIRFPAVKAAEARRDRSAKARIERLCNDMLAVVGRHLDPNKLKVFHEELLELKSLDASDRKLDAQDRKGLRTKK